MSQSHFTLSFPLKSPADARALSQELPPLMPDLFRVENAIARARRGFGGAALLAIRWEAAEREGERPDPGVVAMLQGVALEPHERRAHRELGAAPRRVELRVGRQQAAGHAGDARHRARGVAAAQA